MTLTRDEEKVLRHIRKHGDDRQLNADKYYKVKVELWRKGLLRRRVGDWRWVPTETTR